MKFVAEFQVSKPELPLEYRKSYIAFLKKCLSEVNEGTYFERYYEKGKEKPFTFAVHMQKPAFEKEHICIEGNRINMTFSSAEDMTSFIFFSAFLKQKNRSFPLENGNYMVLKNVVQKREQDVRGKQVLVHMLSPLCIWSIYIDKQYRGKGIADALMQHIIQYAKQTAGIHCIISVITTGNDISVHLHKKYGFTYAGTLHEVGNKFGEYCGIDNYELIL